MEKFGLWWKDSGTGFLIGKEGITKEEAKHILPQILRGKRSSESSLVLVSLPDGTMFYVYVWEGQSAELLKQGEKRVKINTAEKVPARYRFLLKENPI